MRKYREDWARGTSARGTPGSGISFEDRGLAELKGVPGQWRLYSVGSG